MLTAAVALLDSGGALSAGLVAAAVHEGGHLVTMLISPATRVTAFCVTPFGLRITSRGGASSAPTWQLVCVSGVIANLITAALIYLCVSIAGGEFTFAYTLMTANLGLATVNLMPVIPLDGGQLLRAWLVPLGEERAEKVSLTVSLSASLPMLTAGFFILMRSKGNFSLLLMGLWLILCILREYVL